MANSSMALNVGFKILISFFFTLTYLLIPVEGEGRFADTWRHTPRQPPAFTSHPLPTDVIPTLASDHLATTTSPSDVRRPLPHHKVTSYSPPPFHLVTSDAILFHRQVTSYPPPLIQWRQSLHHLSPSDFILPPHPHPRLMWQLPLTSYPSTKWRHSFNVTILPVLSKFLSCYC